MKELYVKDGSLFVTPSPVRDTELIVQNVLELARKTDVTNVKMDLTRLNMFDALKVATLISARGLTQNLDNNYEVLVSNNVIKTQINLLRLSNLTVSLVAPKNNTISIFSKKNMTY